MSIQLTPQQSARLETWRADCARTHPAFATTVMEKVVPKKLGQLEFSHEVDDWLEQLEAAVRAVRNRG